MAGGTRDHIVPKALGGSSHPSNIRKTHKSCNNARGNQMTLTELLWVATQDPRHIYRSTARPLKLRNLRHLVHMAGVLARTKKNILVYSGDSTQRYA
jgi:hypothetical protein